MNNNNEKEKTWFQLRREKMRERIKKEIQVKKEKKLERERLKKQKILLEEKAKLKTINKRAQATEIVKRELRKEKKRIAERKKKIKERIEAEAKERARKRIEKKRQRQIYYYYNTADLRRRQFLTEKKKNFWKSNIFREKRHSYLRGLFRTSYKKWKSWILNKNYVIYPELYKENKKVYSIIYSLDFPDVPIMFIGFVIKLIKTNDNKIWYRIRLNSIRDDAFFILKYFYFRRFRSDIIQTENNYRFQNITIPMRPTDIRLTESLRDSQEYVINNNEIIFLVSSEFVFGNTFDCERMFNRLNDFIVLQKFKELNTTLGRIAYNGNLSVFNNITRSENGPLKSEWLLKLWDFFKDRFENRFTDFLIFAEYMCDNSGIEILINPPKTYNTIRREIVKRGRTDPQFEDPYPDLPNRITKQPEI